MTRKIVFSNLFKVLPNYKVSDFSISSSKGKAKNSAFTLFVKSKGFVGKNISILKAT